MPIYESEATSMLDVLEVALLMIVSFVAILVGLGTIWRSRRGEVVSLSRMSNRVISRRDSPAAFWMTVGMGIFWILLGCALLFVPIAKIFAL
jgi:hypothetical protein